MFVFEFKAVRNCINITKKKKKMLNGLSVSVFTRHSSANLVVTTLCLN